MFDFFLSHEIFTFSFKPAFCPYNGRPFKAIMGFAYAKNVTQCPNAHAHVSIFKGIIHAQNVSLKWNKTQYTIRNTQWTMDMHMNQNAVKSLVCFVDFAIHLFRPMKHLSVHSLNQEYFPKIKLRHLKFPKHN